MFICPGYILVLNIDFNSQYMSLSHLHLHQFDSIDFRGFTPVFKVLD